MGRGPDDVVPASGYPNFVMLYGPTTNNGSILTMLGPPGGLRRPAAAMDDGRGDRRLRRPPRGRRELNEQLQAALDAVAVWQALPDGCYRGRSGRIVTQWPHSMVDDDERLRAIGPELFDTVTALGARRRP